MNRHSPSPPPDLEPESSLGLLLPKDLSEVLRRISDRSTESPILKPDVEVSETLASVSEAMPEEGTPLDVVLSEVENSLQQYGRRNAHPGFFGYVCSPGIGTDPAAHAIGAAFNQNVTSFGSAPGATTIEHGVASWIAQLLGFPSGSAGLFVSGGSLGNFTAIASALYRAGGPALRSRGLARTEGAENLALYIAESGHFSAERAAVLLGIGTDRIRKVSVDKHERMGVLDLERCLDRDRRRGLQPFCVVASAGSTATGSIDPLREIGEISRSYGAWFHVDAAYGGAGMLCPKLVPKFQGIESADSVTVDLHKWFFLAFDGSVVVVRDPQDTGRVFYAQADYVQLPKEGAPEDFAFFHHTLETSRRFRALPAYIALRTYGRRRIADHVHHNVRCARYLADLVETSSDLQLVLDPDLSIVCFRYVGSPALSDPKTVDSLNEEVRQELVRRGRFYLSETKLRGRPVLRVCILSHETTAKEMEALVGAVREIGQEKREDSPAP